jgi:hypothetical protein
VATALALLLLQEPVEVEGQPLAANVARVVQALELAGAPLPGETREALRRAGEDARAIQRILHPAALFVVTVGERTKAQRGRGSAALQQAGWTPAIVKVVNEAGAERPLRISSPQSGPVYAGVAELSMKRQDQPELRRDENVKREPRFLQVELATSPPMTPKLSGLRVEYVLALIYSVEAGRRDATIEFDGAGVPVTFDVRPAIPVRLRIRDHDGAPTTARLTFTDATGRVYPPQPKRLAPDFFFQRQIYRADGGTVLLPPGEFTLTASRGPEYVSVRQSVRIPAEGPAELAVGLKRWIHPAALGFYGGDHHIHAAGCAHYTNPTEGVGPEEMFAQVKGEGLNVGCILTWGPSFDHQSRFFSSAPDRLSEPLTLLKYDIEVSGFGSQALGHVCLLNLREQHYPGSRGTEGWPTWTTPVMRWAKAQGAVTGYAHSASGLQVVPAAAARRLMAEGDADGDGRLAPVEAARVLLPEPFAEADADRDGALTDEELFRSVDRAADRLPNLAVPEMNSVGAMELFVTVPQELCDFISAMDTARLPEWNAWYHVMNCGFPLKVSGETDFPCMSGTRVGQGRVYVRLGPVDRIDYAAWCEGVARGRSYVSDGYAHALEFAVEGRRPGEEVALKEPGLVRVVASVGFSAETPLEVPYGGVMPAGGLRLVGDTVDLHAGEARSSKSRLVELVVNGVPVASREVPADGAVHPIEFTAKIERSSWVALRHFPQLHTNPVNVLVGGRPIRASRSSARWCIAAIEQLWRVRGKGIAAAERDEAKRAFDAAIERYRAIAAESPE